MTEERHWRRCSACKKSIELGADHWVCSVSTCNRKRTGLVFCSVRCWEVHLPIARHRDAGAIEQTAPLTRDTGTQKSPPAERPRRRIVPDAARGGADPKAPREVLIVGSRLKDYVRARSGFNTSDGVLSPLSVAVRRLCDEAIQNARRDGRRTVLDRDIPNR